MRSALVLACAAAMASLLAGCSGKVNEPRRAASAARADSPMKDDSPVKVGEIVRTIQQHHGRVKLELDLAGSTISEAALLETPGLDSATSLNLTGVPLTDAGLAELVARTPELRRIDLSATLVTDAGLEHLKQLPKLEYVVYHSGQISRQALLKLIQFLAQRKTTSAAR